jgi:hypothetical protein
VSEVVGFYSIIGRHGEIGRKDGRDYGTSNETLDDGHVE